MSTLSSRLPSLTLLLVTLACDGSGTSAGPNGAAQGTDVVAVCEAICQRQSRCADEDESPERDTCQAECVSESPEPVLLRADVLRGLSDCYRGLACGQSDDGCLATVLEELVPDYQSSALLSQCSDVQKECGNFADDDCSYAVTFTDAGKQRLQDCLDDGCGAAGSCIDALLSQ